LADKGELGANLTGAWSPRIALSPMMTRRAVAHFGNGFDESLHLIRDNHLIFHGCVPVDAQGEFLPMLVDGVPYTGKALFEALNIAVHRAFRNKH
jgi:fructose-1,6-bisphosphatase